MSLELYSGACHHNILWQYCLLATSKRDLEVVVFWAALFFYNHNAYKHMKAEIKHIKHKLSTSSDQEIRKYI